MVGALLLRPDKAAAAPPESPIREGSPHPPHCCNFSYSPNFSPNLSSQADAVEMRQVRSASRSRSHLSLTLMPVASCILSSSLWRQLVASGGGRVAATSVSWRHLLLRRLGPFPPSFPSPSLPLLCGRCRVTNCSRYHPPRGGRNMQKCSEVVFYR